MHAQVIDTGAHKLDQVSDDNFLHLVKHLEILAVNGQLGLRLAAFEQPLVELFNLLAQKLKRTGLLLLCHDLGHLRRKQLLLMVQL